MVELDQTAAIALNTQILVIKRVKRLESNLRERDRIELECSSTINIQQRILMQKQCLAASSRWYCKSFLCTERKGIFQFLVTTTEKILKQLIHFQIGLKQGGNIQMVIFCSFHVPVRHLISSQVQLQCYFCIRDAFCFCSILTYVGSL
ncbi:Hypothetical_protein [Hexamita inflata]|uniref:Hypothetical_protein n=1 Tax=Hexamita inflata TaxID=28002 RepID=A0AA86N8X1_9EUKA|nr:Hypothetical protein HINF_LOCUS2645 [Hexamita inflata]CAI9915002.1 Hypothetical protein HINF_LOCUS2647 [Hexamita inflata]